MNVYVRVEETLVAIETVKENIRNHRRKLYAELVRQMIKDSKPGKIATFFGKKQKTRAEVENQIANDLMTKSDYELDWWIYEAYFYGERTLERLDKLEGVFKYLHKQGYCLQEVSLEDFELLELNKE